jgi:hypothetical protein
MTKIKENTSLLLKDNTSIVNCIDHINGMIQISKCPVGRLIRARSYT